MSKPGPLAVSDEARELAGNPGKRTKRVPKAPSGVPTIPKDLPADARLHWRRIVPVLGRLGIVSPLDQVALADMCTVIERLQACERDIQERGVLVDGERGLVKNPACQLAREYRQSLQRWATEFGLTPAGRARLSLPEPPKEDELDALLRG